MKAKTLRLGAVWCLFLVLVLLLSPAIGAGEIYDKVIRIHVIANSDSPEDQALKYQVRDAILAYAREELKGKTTQEALEKVAQSREILAAIAQETVKKAGSEDRVTVELGKEVYPTRYYEGLSLPAGEYESLRIKIGRAQGQNWWCMLFPPICLNSAQPDDALVDAGLSPESVSTVKRENGAWEIRFRLVELFSGVKEKLKALFS